MTAILATKMNKRSLDELVETTDKIEGLYELPRVYTVNKSASSPATPQHSDVLYQLLEKMVVDNVLMPRRRNSSLSKHCSQICYYHRMYGDDASECKHSCKYPMFDTALSVKLKRRSLSATANSDHFASRLLQVTNRNYKFKLLVDIRLKACVIRRSVFVSFIHDHHSPRGMCDLHFILYIDNHNNVIAEATSSMELNQIPETPLDFQELAVNQESDTEFAKIASNAYLRYRNPF
ncbi:hypothetical protein ACTXT7_009510 [Hymenolepis weldensis]